MHCSFFGNRAPALSALHSPLTILQFDHTPPPNIWTHGHPLRMPECSTRTRPSARAFAAHAHAGTHASCVKACTQRVHTRTRECTRECTMNTRMHERANTLVGRMHDSVMSRLFPFKPHSASWLHLAHGSFAIWSISLRVARMAFQRRCASLVFVLAATNLPWELDMVRNHAVLLAPLLTYLPAPEWHVGIRCVLHGTCDLFCVTSISHDRRRSSAVWRSAFLCRYRRRSLVSAGTARAAEEGSERARVGGRMGRERASEREWEGGWGGSERASERERRKEREKERKTERPTGRHTRR
eukprot:3134291-Pleurochrysis_carterae.AAC.1